MKKIKVLHCINSLNYGGAERFLLNLLKNLDSERIETHIVVRGYPNRMESQFENLGCNIIKAPPFPKNYISHYHFMKKNIFTASNEYDVVHIHANSLIYTLPIKLIKKHFPKTKILLHSHSSKSTSNLVTMIHNMNKKRYLNDIQIKIAVSKDSKKWMFDNHEAEIIYNGLNTSEYYFNKRNRELIRQELNISDNEILLGTVGRLVPVKNFKFLIHLIENLTKQDKNKKYKLLIVGEGELDSELKQLAKVMNIENKVIFAGRREDIPAVLSGMDIYLQPSLFEGLPFSVIEAQVSGLITIVSDNITNEVNISKNIYFESIEEIKKWTNLIMSFEGKYNREDISNNDLKKINISEITTKFKEIYMNA